MSDQANKRATLLLAVVSGFVTPLMGSAVNIALPAISAELKMDAVVLSWVNNAWLLAVAVGLVPAGRLADIHGRKRFFTWGMSLFTLATVVVAAAPTTFVLLLGRVCQGAGSAMIFSTGVAILSSVFPPGERGRALGLNVAAVYSGLSVGPFLGGFLTSYLHWRSIFAVVIPLGLLAVYVSARKVQGEWAEARGERFDLLGSLIYGAGLITLLQGATHLPGRLGLALVAAGLIGLAVFLVYESRVAQPVFDLTLFRTNRVFALSSLAALINYGATFAVTFLLSLYLQNVRGLSPISAGMILVAQPIFQASISPLAGRLSDRVEPRIVASSGMVLTALGLFLLSRLSQDTSTTYIVGCLVLLGVGFGLFSSPNMNAIMGSVEKRFYGLAAGVVATMRTLGNMVSMAIATTLFALFIGRVQITPIHAPALVRSLQVGLFIFGLLCLAGIFASLARGNLSDPKTRS